MQQRVGQKVVRQQPCGAEMQFVQVVDGFLLSLGKVLEQGPVGMLNKDFAVAGDVLETVAQFFDALVVVGHFLAPDLVVEMLDAGLVAIFDGLAENGRDSGQGQMLDPVLVVHLGPFDGVHHQVAAQALEFVFPPVPVETGFESRQIRHRGELAEQLDGHAPGGLDEARTEVHVVAQVVDSELEALDRKGRGIKFEGDTRESLDGSRLDGRHEIPIRWFGSAAARGDRRRARPLPARL